ncbi:hypothetical protein BCR33DRAFT_765641 [Rhizoclosmatium globosum]|uniref:Ribosomal protein L37e n=1 Tax=Rhizoclosmatium globosum TaxID=329046 RepID=A0A1Y2CDT7_9FUNG|nr:hypothetical protein BCR33DRAFT_765641 [Rhizoclosmatium globosum]|eukprot:ORY45230.1 hypothetical protein BCR33DRAFT_765641 [Rhizoclosmatium globosum]
MDLWWSSAKEDTRRSLPRSKVNQPLQTPTIIDPLFGTRSVNRITPKQTKGTQSFGKRHNKSHTLCRRCGRRSFHCQKKTCAQCGYPAAKLRSFEWATKAQRRKTTGTGRCAYIKTLTVRFKNGFREGSQAKPRKSA